MSDKKLVFTKTPSKSDEWYTPLSAIYPILDLIKDNSVIWCPFDKLESNFVKVFSDNGHTVINGHIDNGEDFFNIEIPKCDYIISNPPFSKRNTILTRLFSFGIPFMMIMNSNGLFDSQVRWNLFKQFNFTLVYLSKRVNFMKEMGVEEKGSPTFQSLYVCHKISDKQIIFKDLLKDKQ